jgi:hypothetical protein
MEVKQVPVLITWDVDPDRWTTLEKRQAALTSAIDLCEEIGIKSTFFVTANFAHEYLNLLTRMQALNQEIGCHGLTHTDEENYDRMPVDMQKTYIEEATLKLKSVINGPVISFRSPRVRISAVTHNLLVKQGYLVDSSVCSQRIDFLSSNLVNPGWIFAPRLPYHPHPTNAFKSGKSRLWEIPISAIVVPLISGSLNVFGLRLMKLLFKLLYFEAKLTGKPIVYLGHPSEFISTMKRRENVSLKQFSLSSIRTHGFLFRNLFFRMDGEQWYKSTREFLTYVASFHDVVFLTAGEYAERLSYKSAQTV